MERIARIDSCNPFHPRNPRLKAREGGYGLLNLGN